MEKGLRIKEAAKERGVTLSSIAEKLGIPRSNMSAIASGARGVSLKILQKISRILDCSIDELTLPERPAAVFKDKKIQSKLVKIEKQNSDGLDKTWVNTLMLAQIAHYKAAKKPVK